MILTKANCIYAISELVGKKGKKEKKNKVFDASPYKV